MKLINNPANFFLQLDKLAEKTANFVENNKTNMYSTEYIGVYFPPTKPIPLDDIASNIFQFVSIDRLELDYKDSIGHRKTLFKYEDLIKLSTDNKDYYVFTHKAVTEFCEELKENKRKQLYICDISETYYSIIDINNVDYFLTKIQLNMLGEMKKYGKTVRCYYSYNSSEFLIDWWDSNEKFLDDCRNFRKTTLFSFRKSFDECTYDYEDIDFEKEYSSFLSFNESVNNSRYANIIPKLNNSAEKCIEEMKGKEISVFGQTISDFSQFNTQKVKMLASIIALTSDMLDDFKFKNYSDIKNFTKNIEKNFEEAFSKSKQYLYSLNDELKVTTDRLFSEYFNLANCLNQYLTNTLNESSETILLQEVRLISNTSKNLEEDRFLHTFNHLPTIACYYNSLTVISEKFIKELIFNDLECLVYKWIFDLVCAVEKNEDKIDVTFLNLPLCFKNLLDEYLEASTFYMEALSLHLELDDFEKENEGLSALEMMEEAILKFPYSKLFYKKYFEFGGKMTEDIKTFATLNRVDLSDLYEKEEKRLLAEQRSKEEYEKLKAEKKRLAEEKLQKVKDTMTERFGEELINSYPDLFIPLATNPIFVENSDTEFTSPQQVTEAVFSYIDKKLKGKGDTLISPNNSSFAKKLNNVSAIYGAKDINKNTVLFLFDATLFGSGKDGFVVSEEYFCFRNMLSNANMIAIKNIKKISNDNTNTIINDKYTVETNMCGIGAKEVVNILTFCICNLLKLNLTNTTNEINTQGWKCSCGNINDINTKFCGECGSKKAEEPQDWICSNCNTKNPANSKFCGECGTPKGN